MKKFFLCLIVLLLLSAACAEEALLPVFTWERDGLNHWQLNEAGEMINLGEHTSDENEWVCAVCGSEVLDWGDGMIDVTDYDEYGNLLRYTSFENGEITYDSAHMFTYSAEGLLLKDVEFINGVLYGETIYTVSEEGAQIPVTQTAWNDDGTTSINYYDEHGNCIRAAIFYEDGSLFFETLSEYALNEYGWYYECKTTSHFDTGETFYSESNEYGDTIRSRNTNTDGTVWSDWYREYEYRDGLKRWCKQYSDDKLTLESYFNDLGDLAQEIEYLEDGGKIVYQYTEFGDLDSITTYAADGSVISVTEGEAIWEEEDF